MAGEAKLPNLGLYAGWNLGTNGWKPGMDGNLATLDALLFLTVLSASVGAPPSSPTAGDRYIVAASATGAWSGKDGQVAVFVAGAWKFYAGVAGLVARVSDASTDLRYDGTAWTRLNPYDIQVWRWRLPNPAAETPTEPLLSLMLPRSVQFFAGFVGAMASLKVATTNALTFNVQQNGATIGTVNFAAGASNGTFTLSSATTFAAGDVFEVYPQSFDPTAKGLRIVFVGYR